MDEMRPEFMNDVPESHSMVQIVAWVDEEGRIQMRLVDGYFHATPPGNKEIDIKEIDIDDDDETLPDDAEIDAAGQVITALMCRVVSDGENLKEELLNWIDKEIETQEKEDRDLVDEMIKDVMKKHKE